MIGYSLLAANDNAIGDDECSPVVISDDRPDHAYARHGNLILPLRFAQRMTGWKAVDRVDWPRDDLVTRPGR